MSEKQHTDLDTPPDSSPSLEPVSSLPRSPLAELSANVAGAMVAIVVVTSIAPMLSSACGDERWKWGLGALVLIAVPALAVQLFRFARTALEIRRR